LFSADRIPTVASPSFMRRIFTRLKSRLVRIAVGAFLCVEFGCENSSQIVGKWRTSSDANPMVWEFSKDRSVLMGQIRGKYTFGDSDRMKVQTPFATFVYHVQLAGDQLILREPSGSKLVFTRIR
jgi:hypothetical protein